MLREFFRAVRFEFAKAIRAKFAWMLILIPAAAAALATLGPAAAGRIAELAEGEAAPAKSAFLFFARGAGAGLTLGAVLLLLYSSLSLSSEGNLGTFKTVLLRPLSRGSWLAAKFAVLAFFAILLLLAVSAAAWACAAAASDFIDVAEDGYVIYEHAYLQKTAFTALGLAVPALLALAAFGLMFSAATDHPGIATSLCLGFFVFLETAKLSFPERKLYFFNAFVPSLVDTSYFQVLRGVADGLSDVLWEPGMIAYNIGTPLVSAAAFAAVAAAIFVRRNMLV